MSFPYTPRNAVFGAYYIQRPAHYERAFFVLVLLLAGEGEEAGDGVVGDGEGAVFFA